MYVVLRYLPAGSSFYLCRIRRPPLPRPRNRSIQRARLARLGKRQSMENKISQTFVPALPCLLAVEAGLGAGQSGGSVCNQRARYECYQRAQQADSDCVAKCRAALPALVPGNSVPASGLAHSKIAMPYMGFVLQEKAAAATSVQV